MNTIPYSILGLLSGYLTRSNRRALIFGIIMIAMSSFHLTSAVTTSFSVVFLMRVLHGAISSATDPVSYSLIADYFPPEKRGTANAILSTGNFIGIAMSSLSIILIK